MRSCIVCVYAVAALFACEGETSAGDAGAAGGAGGGGADAVVGGMGGLGGDDAPDAAATPDAAPTPGFARLTFGVTEGVRANPTLTDALQGRVLGDLFLGVDVGLMGPVEGAARYGSVDLPDVDLTAEGAVSSAWTSGPLAPGEYIFLGMMDLDGNAAEFDDSPDDGDLATLPLHRFTVTAGETVDVLVEFELVYN